MPAESRLCRRCPSHAGSVPACDCVPDTLAESRLCPGHASNVPACDCVQDTLAESRLCRQCPGHAGSVPVCDCVPMSSNSSEPLSVPSVFQSRSRAVGHPIVTCRDFGRASDDYNRNTIYILITGFIVTPESWRTPPEMRH